MGSVKFLAGARRVGKLTALAAAMVCLTAASVSKVVGGSYERGLRSTVLIRGPHGAGSGVLVDGPRRLVATALHVVNGNLHPDGTVEVFFAQSDGKGRLITDTSHYDAKRKELAIRARVVGKDNNTDLAIIQLERLPAGMEAAPLAAESPTPGTKIFIIGHSDIHNGGVFSYCTGYVRNVARKHNGPRQILHATPTNPGDSGGPLFNDNDEVVGLVSNGTDGMTAANVRNIARRAIEEAKAGLPQAKTPPQRDPQVLDYAVDVNDVRTMLNGLPKTMPAPAAAAAVKQGDMVKSFSGKLTKTDPLDGQRTKCHSKVYEVALKAGQTYVIDLMSGDGQAGPNNPGFFDTYLRIEDAKGTEVAKNDDGGLGRNSRIEHQPAQDGTLRIIVTSYADGATGDFTLEIRQKAK